jgi:chromosome segregation ATPase
MESFKLERSNEEKQQDVLKLSAAKKDLESNLKRNDEELSHFEAKVEEMQLQMTMMREELCKMTEVKSALESMLTRKEEENFKLAACLEEARSDSDEKTHISTN